MSYLRIIILLFLFVPFAATAEETPNRGKIQPLSGVVQPITEPPCSYCSTQHLKDLIQGKDRVIAWLRASHNGGAFPIRHFLSGPRVVNDTYGLFFYDPDGGYVSAFEKDYGYQFHGWRNGVMVVRHTDGTIWSALTGIAIEGPRKGETLKRIPSLVTNWNYWLMLHPESTTYDLFEGKTYKTTPLPVNASAESLASRSTVDPRMNADSLVIGLESKQTKIAVPIPTDVARACYQVDLDDRPIAVFWYSATQTSVAFQRKVGDRVLNFYADEISPETAPFKDRETGTRWSLAGRGIDGPLRGIELNWTPSIQCQWHAWSSEYPETAVFDTTLSAK